MLIMQNSFAKMCVRNLILTDIKKGEHEMAQTVSFDFKNAANMAPAEEIAAMKEQVTAAKETLVNKTGEGNDFLGWIDLPVDMTRENLPE